MCVLDLRLIISYPLFTIFTILICYNRFRSDGCRNLALNFIVPLLLHSIQQMCVWRKLLQYYSIHLRQKNTVLPYPYGIRNQNFHLTCGSSVSYSNTTPPWSSLLPNDIFSLPSGPRNTVAIAEKLRYWSLKKKPNRVGLGSPGWARVRPAVPGLL